MHFAGRQAAGEEELSVVDRASQLRPVPDRNILTNDK